MTIHSVAGIRNKIPATLAAINNENRAEAWYEIRYGSNKGGGHTNRRYIEANEFGLYDDGVLTADQTKEIMRMYTRYEYEGLGSGTLSTYEQTYPPPSGIDVITGQNGIGKANDYLVLNFAKGKTIDGWVIVGRGLDSYNYIEKGNWAENIIGTNKNDLIFGEKGSDIIDGNTGDDVIYGGEGDDDLMGGKGDDLLIGGEGEDTYYYTSGDGNDTIIDSGQNRIIYEDASGNVHAIEKFYKTGADVYTAAAGEVILTHHSPWQITTDDGGTITLGDNAQPDDFGIKLLDVPDAPQTTNNITEPTNPSEPNKFYDTAANDKIIATGGNDGIYSWNGGDDWIIAGDGRDVVDSERITWTTFGDGEIYVEIPEPGNDIIEGGSGGDLINGGLGDDKIYADNYGDMNTLISEGAEAQSINEQGDLITGNRGNDFIFGSNRNDALFGGPDDDLISGGGGNDFISGDDDFAGADFDWSFTIGPNYTVSLSKIYDGVVPPGGTFPPAIAGDDEIYAGSGDDYAIGGEGDDLIYGEAGNDILFGGAGNDSLFGGADDDYIQGDGLQNTGDDYIDGGSGGDLISGEKIKLRRAA